MNRFHASHAVFVQARRLLKDPDEEVREIALSSLHRMREEEVPRKEILPFLISPRADTSAIAYSILRGPVGTPQNEPVLSSAEAAPLLKSSMTMGRLTALKNLQQNGDARAVESILPVLTDTNTIVRNRAFAVLRNISGEKISDEPAKWQQWWSANKASFKARHSANN
jgi:HEAT repeat protein